MDKYMKFLNNLPKHWDYKAVQLDVFGEPEKTYINYLKMLDAGFKDIMPVFTRGDTLERLEEFYTYTDYIMFGGIVVGGKNQNYVKWFCENNKGRKAHWLGFAKPKFLKFFKPESVDCSSHLVTRRWGRLQLYKGFGHFEGFDKSFFNTRPSKKFIRLAKNLGFGDQIKKLQDKEAWSGGYTDNTTIKGTASYITSTCHVLRSIDMERNINTKIYLAIAQRIDIDMVFQSLQHIRERKLI